MRHFFTKAIVCAGVMASALALNGMAVFAADKWETVTVASGTTQSESGYITNLKSSSNNQEGNYTFTYNDSVSTTVTTTNRTSDIKTTSDAPIITIPDGYKGTVFMVCTSSGSSGRTLTYTDETDSNNTFTLTTPTSSGYGVVISSVKDLSAGTYKETSQTGNWKYAAVGLYLAETEISTTPTLSLIANGDGTINVGDTLQLTAKLNKFELTSGSYESNNTAVATVDQNGLITSVGEGTATITYTATGAGTLEPNVTELVDTYDVTVIDPYVSTATTWDFSEYEQKLNLEGTNYTTTYSKLNLVGNSSGSGGKDYVSNVGFHTNGGSTTSRRYISLIPGVDGTLTVTFVSNNLEEESRSCFIGTAVNTTKDSGDVVAYTTGVSGTVEGDLTAFKTYYVYVDNGITIQSLKFTPTATSTTVSGSLTEISGLTASDGIEVTPLYAKVNGYHYLVLDFIENTALKNLNEIQYSVSTGDTTTRTTLNTLFREVQFNEDGSDSISQDGHCYYAFMFQDDTEKYTSISGATIASASSSQSER